MKARTFTGSTQQFQDYETVDDATNAAQAAVEAADASNVDEYVDVYKVFSDGVVVWATAFYSENVYRVDKADLS